MANGAKVEHTSLAWATQPPNTTVVVVSNNESPRWQAAKQCPTWYAVHREAPGCLCCPLREECADAQVRRKCHRLWCGARHRHRHQSRYRRTFTGFNRYVARRHPSAWQRDPSRPSLLVRQRLLSTVLPAIQRIRSVLSRLSRIPSVLCAIEYLRHDAVLSAEILHRAAVVMTARLNPPPRGNHQRG